jgi:hypothetical protein
MPFASSRALRLRAPALLAAALTVVAGSSARLEAQAGSRTRSATDTGRTMAVPIPAGQQVPDLPKAPPVPTTYVGLFAERDARAQAALGYLRCMQKSLEATKSGAFGTVQPEWTLVCVRAGKEWRGVLMELTAKDPGARVHRQLAMRGAGKVVTDAVDTAAVSSTARALRRALSVPVPGKGVGEFTPVVLAEPSQTEIWFLPLPGDRTRTLVGGDSVIQMAADGNRELGHASRTPPIRALTIPAGSTSLTVSSLEERLPLVSELLAARVALEWVPEVRIRTTTYEAVLTRATGTWKHTSR